MKVDCLVEELDWLSHTLGYLGGPHYVGLLP